MFCCLTAKIARTLLCMANAEFRIQVMVEVVVACPEPEYCHLFPSGYKIVGVKSCCTGGGRASTCCAAWP